MSYFISQGQVLSSQRGNIQKVFSCWKFSPVRTLFSVKGIITIHQTLILATVNSCSGIPKIITTIILNNNNKPTIAYGNNFFSGSQNCESTLAVNIVNKIRQCLKCFWCWYAVEWTSNNYHIYKQNETRPTVTTPQAILYVRGIQPTALLTVGQEAIFIFTSPPH